MANEECFGGSATGVQDVQEMHGNSLVDGFLEETIVSGLVENGGDAVNSEDPAGDLNSGFGVDKAFNGHGVRLASASSLREGGTEVGAVDGPVNGSQVDGAGTPYPIVVHCHLRWDWVWQRPQQFLTRLSQRHPILFVQGPLVEDGDFEPFFRLTPAEGFPNVTLMDSVFPRERFFKDGAWVDAERTRLVREAIAGPLGGKFDLPVQWFYDPMAVPSFLGQLNERANVYDCMDQLSQFKFAPPALIEREQILLKAADVVFAGGRKMWEDKQKSNANSHFYGCGVDVEHFAQARDAKTPIPTDLAAVSSPILGYFGVVDERMDYPLVAALADAHPEWTLAIVGPTCKVEPEDLPQRPNIHWLGGREYSQLPSYAKAFDVCLMPFALNEATEFINPTKALEYMATERPIVSSAVPDVVSNFADVVRIGHSHEEFVSLCEQAVSNPDGAAVERGLEMADNSTWDSIVAQLEGHVDNVLARKKTSVAS
jgi:glycosyltransferase involved in cell wall biosynthesis